MKRKESLKGVSKSAIIEEYLTGEDTYVTLGEKYGIPHRTIQTWVRAYRKSESKTKAKGGEISSAREKELLDELEKSRLKNELLEEIIKLSEQNTGVDLRKKFGSKQ